MPNDRDIDAPVSLQGLWPDSDDEVIEGDESGFKQEYETQTIEVCSTPLQVRQFIFHSKNANRVWPGTFNLAEYYLSSETSGDINDLKNKKVLELGSATGLLAIRLIQEGVTVITCDYKDEGEIKDNILHNFTLNNLPHVPHIEHTWGTGWVDGGFDVIVASDILLYCGVYKELVFTLKELIDKPEKKFVMSWNRRMEESKEFFELMEDGGFVCEHLGKCVYLFMLKT
ncbi:hypothetical protein TL16_g09891 [Triparma laevis f. inornata]|uniref:Uncharacterized protein n=2 Tax=Triparma laevis TaxID=1534972 RepID=A0A9W7KWU6_9STRA|nr:hypothetical protein TL16_g09891 [Triparma laevis f. inornata]GMI14703.1 hypothetical protein TrLO_g12514 [Triparma laevis f. longispina]